MTRDLTALTEREFDVLVVGAGIYGATIACDAAQRGLSVALIDRGDFGGGTSLNSLKTVHGGLRSLQRGNVVDMRRFLHERRAFLRIAPHLVEPLRFAIPTYPQPKRSHSLMRAALALNDVLGHDRNQGLDPARQLGPSGVIDRGEMLRLFAGLDRSRVTGGATWYEAQMYNADRVLLAFVQSAVALGAVAANYVGVDRFLQQRNRVIGVSARDALGDSAFDVRARITVNATGGWAPALMASITGKQAPPGLALSQALNLVTRLPAPACALGDSVDGQFLFCVPWRGRAAFGTFHTAFAGTADQLASREPEASRFLTLINRAFPEAHARLDDVTLVHRGLLPMTGIGANGEVHLTKISCVRDHRADGVAGLVSVVGVRFTTARRTAQDAVDLLGRLLERVLPSSRSATTPLAGGEIADLGSFLNEAQRAMSPFQRADVDRIARSYGTAYPRVLRTIASNPAHSSPLSDSCPVTRGEVLYAAREEMGVRLADVLLRRTEAGSAEHPGRDAVESAAALLAAEHGWDRARVAAEIELVDARFTMAPMS